MIFTVGFAKIARGNIQYCVLRIASKFGEDMSTAVPTKNLTTSVRVDFEDGQIHAAEPRKIGAFIDGYEAMAADTQREKEA